MATKKVAPKKAAKPAKAAHKASGKTSAKPAVKAGGKGASVKKSAPAPKKAIKSAPAKAKAPVKKMAVKMSKPTPAKTSKPSLKQAAKPVQAPKKPLPPTKKLVQPAKPAAKAPVPAEPIKKPAVTAHSQQTTKAATKPLEAKQVKKEPAKPAKVVIPKTSTDKAIKYEPDFTRSVLDTSKQEENGPTMRYSDAELAEFRDLINRKLDVAKKELAYLQGLITRKDESGDLDEGRYMTMEDGSMSMEREQLSQMASRQIQFIDHLEKALMRIENKTYGICRVTGKLIDKARLRAVPHATLSIEAKQMMNK